MASHWFYKRQGTKFGPVTTQQLKALAASAHIAPSDLVWKEGMADWTKASRLKGLFQQVAGGDSAPPTPLLPPTEVSAPPPTAKDTFGHRLRAAGQLVVKQAKRTRLAVISLPHAYRVLGRHIEQVGAFQSDFPDLFRQSDALRTGMASPAGAAAVRPSAEGLHAKLNAVAIVAREMADAKVFEMRIAQIHGKFGNAAFDKHGVESGPAELVEPITQLRTQIAKLDEAINDLAEVGPGQFLTTKRILFGGIAAVLLFAILILFTLSGIGNPLIPKPEKSTMAPSVDPSAQVDGFSGMGGEQPHNAGGPPAASQAKQLTLDLGNGVALKLVEIPAGKFTMGSPDQEKKAAVKEAVSAGIPEAEATDAFKDEVQHEVTISKPFYMGITHVTVDQFAAFVKDSGYKTDAENAGWSIGFEIKDGVLDVTKANGCSWRSPSFDQEGDHPVVQVKVGATRKRSAIGCRRRAARQSRCQPKRSGNMPAAPAV
jgi:hypothetical protein